MASLLPNQYIIETAEGRKFRVLSLLAEGGFSNIYRAEEIIGDEKRRVLLKAFYAEDQDGGLAEGAGWIQHELQINRKIALSGFTGALTIDYSVHDQKDGTVYGVMSADRSGVTLREYVSQSYGILKDRIGICRQLLYLAGYFHKKCHMIHGDITPDNVFLLNTESASEQDDSHVWLYWTLVSRKTWIPRSHSL